MGFILTILEVVFFYKFDDVFIRAKTISFNYETSWENT